MDITVIEKTKTRAELEFEGENHTMLNVLRDELWNDKNVTAAAYTIPHPLLNKAVFFVETKGKDPVKAIEDAIKRLKKINSEAGKAIVKAIK